MNLATAIFGAVTLVGGDGALSALTYLHIVPTNLSPWRNAVSQYGISAHRNGYRLATISLGISGIAAAIGIKEAMGDRQCTQVLVLLIVFGVARLVISWFPMDTPGAERTSTGATHNLIAIVTFLTATFAALRLGATLHREHYWGAIGPVANALGVVMAIVLVSMFLLRFMGLRQYFGAVERLFYVAMIGFVTFVGVVCTWRVH